MAVYLLYGYRFWVGILLGGLAAGLVSGESIPIAVVLAFAGTFGTLVAPYLMRKFGGFQDQLMQLRDVAALLFFGVLLGCSVPSLIGVASLSLAGFIPIDAIPMAFFNGLIGLGIGVLIVTSLLITLSDTAFKPLTRKSGVEALGILLLMEAAGTIIFSPLVEPNERNALVYLLIPFVIWAALRFQTRGAAVAATTVLGITLIVGVGGYGLFAESERALLLIALFNAVVVSTGLVIGASVAERMQAEDDLRAMNANLQSLIAERTGELVENEHRYRTLLGNL